jgi:tetratricopeptide (TPR) repeat protein
MTLSRDLLRVTTVLLLLAGTLSAQEQDSSTPGSRARRRDIPTSTLGYGLGNDPVAERYLTSLDYQDVRLKQTRKDSQGREIRPGQTQVNVGELSVPEKALEAFRQGRELQAKGKPDDALKRYRKAVEIHPAYGRAWVQMATVYREAGKLAEAENALLKAVEVAPGNLAARKNLGYLYLGTNRPALAVPHLAEATRLEPSDVGARAFLGDALFKTGRYEEAESALKTALTLDSKCYPAAYRLSALYAGQRKFPEAIALLENVLRQEHPGIETGTLQTLVTRMRELGN